MTDINRLNFECTLLAKAWIERARLEQDEITRQQIDALAEQHFMPGILEPISDRVPHPWRMTPELAEALSVLVAMSELYESGMASDEKHLIQAAERVAALVKEQAR